MRYNLTPAEKQCIDLVRAGLSNRDIAGWLAVAERTVKTHLYRSYRKLKVKSRAECIVLLGVNRKKA